MMLLDFQTTVLLATVTVLTILSIFALMHANVR